MRVSVSLVLGVGLGCSSPALWAETESPAELEVLTVTAEAERAEGPVQGYRANRTASATRTDTRIEDIPQAISVVPRQVLDDLDSARIERALDFAGGVSRQNNFGGLTMFEYNVRGFTHFGVLPRRLQRQPRLYERPGQRHHRARGNPQGTGLQPLRARRSRRHGEPGDQEAPGRALRPPACQRRQLGPLPLDPGPEHAAGRRGRPALPDEPGGGGQQGLPRLRRRPAPAGGAIVQLATGPGHLVAGGSRGGAQPPGLRPRHRGAAQPPGSLPRSRFFGEPDDGKIDNNNETLQATLRHHFNEQWSLRLASHYKHGHLDGYASENSSLAADGYSLRREYRYRDFEWHDSITQLDLLGDLHTGSIRHQLLMGLEYERYHNDELILRSIPSRNPYAIDIRRPVYGQPKPPLRTRRPQPRGSRRDGPSTCRTRSSSARNGAACSACASTATART